MISGQIKVYLFIEGGNLQGASCNIPDIDIILYDKDNASQDENYLPYEEWDKFIEEETKQNRLSGIYVRQPQKSEKL